MANKVLYRFFFMFFVVSYLFAGTDGTVRGRIIERDSGEPLAGAQIYIPDLGIGTMADLDGNYILLNVHVGTYDIKCSMIGYADAVYKNVSVQMDQTYWLNVGLEVKSVEGETVYVTGERALVEKGTTSKKITISQEAIEALPIRDVSELYSLQSGVVKVEGSSRGAIQDNEEKGIEEVHVRGGRSAEIAYMIDGMYIRNPIMGGIGTGTRMNTFAIEEFDWQPGGFNAEYGDAMSAVSNIHTASGKDEFRFKLKYESSAIGAQAFDNKYDELRGFNDYNLGFGGRIPYMDLIPLVENVYYWVSGQHTTRDAYRVFEFDDIVYDSSNVMTNILNSIYPWDNQTGFRDFGFSETTDYFGKLTFNLLSNRMKINYSYWDVYNHQKSFNVNGSADDGGDLYPGYSRYLYWDDGQGELFKDTYRHTVEVNHTLSSKIFYTFRYSKFTQDQFLGVRWKDSDEDGLPDWFEYKKIAGTPTNEIAPWLNFENTSDVDNADVVPYEEVGDQLHYTNVDGLGPTQWSSGWYNGAPVPGNYNWEGAESFEDVNNDGLFTPYWDANGNNQMDEGEWIDAFLWENYIDLNNDGEYNQGEPYQDINGDGSWDTFQIDQSLDNDLNDDGIWNGPTLVQECEYRDGSYWLTPEMYVDYANFFDELAYFHDIQIDPYYSYVDDYGFAEDDFNLMFMSEGNAFGGHDNLFSDSRAITDEMRLDVTAQVTDKWRTRVGGDIKSHKLTFYEIKYPWLGGGAIRQRFAEYWEDVGIDGVSFLDTQGEPPDDGENNGQWDEGEPFDDFNGDGVWNDYVEPQEFAFYWQNTFEVPWMVINAGVRVDGVNYNTKVWMDPDGEYSAYKPWSWFDCGTDNLCPDNEYLPGESHVPDADGTEMDGEWQSSELTTDAIGESYTKVLFKNSEWLWKVSPRLGFSHIITDQATFTFNYGLYYQTPVYQNVYLNTNRQSDPAETFEESDGNIGNATMTASRTQAYEFGFNVQVGRHWAFSIMGWVKDMDQLVTAKNYRSGIYEYMVSANGDYATATGIDFTLENRGLLVNTMLQYTYSKAVGNGDYDQGAFGSVYVNAPSQQYMMSFDRTHDLTLSMYTFLPFGITAGLTGFYQSGYPYTPVKWNGDKPESDLLNKNTLRSDDHMWANLQFSKSINLSKFKLSLGLTVDNLFNNVNAYNFHSITGQPDDPGEYYTDEIGEVGGPSSAYYDRPWYVNSPREFNFFMRFDYK